MTESRLERRTRATLKADEYATQVLRSIEDREERKFLRSAIRQIKTQGYLIAYR